MTSAARLSKAQRLSPVSPATAQRQSEPPPEPRPSEGATKGRQSTHYRQKFGAAFARTQKSIIALTSLIYFCNLAIAAPNILPIASALETLCDTRQCPPLPRALKGRLPQPSDGAGLHVIEHPDVVGEGKDSIQKFRQPVGQSGLNPVGGFAGLEKEAGHVPGSQSDLGRCRLRDNSRRPCRRCSVTGWTSAAGPKSGRTGPPTGAPGRAANPPAGGPERGCAGFSLTRYAGGHRKGWKRDQAK